MEKATRRQSLLCKIEELDYKIRTYDSTFSDADEYTPSKEDLENLLEDLKSQLKDVEKV